MNARELADALSGWVEQHRSNLVETLQQLGSFDAPTGEPALLDETAEFLSVQLERLGAVVTRWPTPAGTHLQARFGPDDGSPMMILGHYDTVWPRGTAAARPIALDDGRVTGPGVFDMRGGLTASLHAIRALSELSLIERPVSVLFTADEEAGSQTSRDLIEQLGTEAAAVLIPEPSLPGGGLKTERRGVITYRFEITGREAHAGLDPDRGISAIRELVDLIARVERLADPAVGTQINVGVIGGGTRPNVIPGSAFAEVDVRVARADEYDRVTAAMTGLAGSTSHPAATVTVTTVQERPPMERTLAIREVVDRAKQLARLIGLELAEGAAGGGSDGNFLAPLNVPVVDGLGPEGDGAHARDEFIVLRSLHERTVLLGLLLLLL